MENKETEQVPVGESLEKLGDALQKLAEQTTPFTHGQMRLAVAGTLLFSSVCLLKQQQPWDSPPWIYGNNIETIIGNIIEGKTVKITSLQPALDIPKDLSIEQKKVVVNTLTQLNRVFGKIDALVDVFLVTGAGGIAAANILPDRSKQVVVSDFVLSVMANTLKGLGKLFKG